MTNFQKSKRQRADMPKLDRRNFQRVKINVLGRYMLENHQEFPCHIRDMSPGSLAMSGPVQGEVGEHVVAYIDHVGRIEGTVSRIFEGGFAMAINATGRKRDKLSAQLTWLANRHERSLPEDRRHLREAPKTQSAILTLHDGTQVSARILDMSLSGAALSFKRPAQIGMPIMVGKIRSRIVRIFEDGIAVEFAKVQAEEHGLKD